MMTGDDIQKQRQHAEKDFDKYPGYDSHISLALWVIAEQLYEIRKNLGILIDRKGEK